MEGLRNSKYVLSITFGDYKHTAGGVAKVILAHQDMFQKRGISYVCIFPFNLSNTRYVKNNRYWGIRADGLLIGVFSAKGLIDYLAELNNVGCCCECIHIHHLLHINVIELSKIIRCFHTKVFFYIHDYYTICKSITLIGDDGALCRKDFLNTERCRKCRYYKDSIASKKKFQQFAECFKRRITFICPSDACKKWFLKQYGEYADQTAVIYHQTLSGKYRIPKKQTQVIKIGYVGAPIPAKGWNQFKRLYEKYGKDERYQFVYFSSVLDHTTDMRNVSVNFQSSLSAMQDALRAERVDYAVLWSVWPETYSYTYYESYGAGCCVLTNLDSGNLADQVIRMKSGLILTEDELFDYFSDFEKAKSFRDSYIAEKKEVCLSLDENDAIVDMSDMPPMPFSRAVSGAGHIEIFGKLLKLAYIIKLKVKRQD